MAAGPVDLVEEDHPLRPALRTRHHRARGLAEVAVRARSHEVARAGGAPNSDGNYVVDMEHDAGVGGGPTAVLAAEAISLEDGEPQPRGGRLTGLGQSAMHRRPGHSRRGIAELSDATLSLHARRTVTQMAGADHRPGYGEMAPVGVEVPGWAGPVGLVNADNPDVVSLGRNADLRELRLLRPSGVRTTSQVDADPQQPEQR